MIPHDKGMELSAIVGSMLIAHRRSVAVAMGVGDNHLLALLAHYVREPEYFKPHERMMFHELQRGENLRKEFSNMIIPLIEATAPLPVYHNIVGGTLFRIPSKQDVLAYILNVEQRDQVERSMDREGVTAVVIFENLDMSSSGLGNMAAVMVGPEFTYKTVAEAAAGRLGDVPSRFQYPVAYYEKQN